MQLEFSSEQVLLVILSGRRVDSGSRPQFPNLYFAAIWWKGRHSQIVGSIGNNHANNGEYRSRRGSSPLIAMLTKIFNTLY